MHYAAFCGYTDVVEVLLDAGADTRRVSSDGRTALSTAAEEGHSAVVRLLVDALPPGTTDNGGGASPVDARVASSSPRTVANEHPQSPQHAPLSPGARAASSGALSTRGGGGGTGVPSGAPVLSHAQGIVRLCDAVQAGDLRSVNVLLMESRVDVNGVDGDGFTALHRAAATGATLLVDVLLGHGADPNARDAVRQGVLRCVCV